MSISMGGGNWRGWGQKVKDWLEDRLDASLHGIGQQVVERAQQLAPVDTGELRDSIYYVVVGEGITGKSLTIAVGAPHGIFQEFGTRNIPPHPFIRPAVNEVGRIWVPATLDFAGPAGAGRGEWHGLIAGMGRGRAGFAASASARWKPLTAKQVKHVESKLIPSIKKYNIGNTRRATLRVRRP